MANPHWETGYPRWAALKTEERYKENKMPHTPKSRNDTVVGAASSASSLCVLHCSLPGLWPKCPVSSLGPCMTPRISIITHRVPRESKCEEDTRARHGKVCVRHVSLSPPGVHAHDGAQQLAALDCMVPALLPLPPHCHLLHDPALLHQGECGFTRVSDVKSMAFKLIGGQRQP